MTLRKFLPLVTSTMPLSAVCSSVIPLAATRLLAVLLSAALLLSACGDPAEPEMPAAPVTLLSAARIYTMDTDIPQVEALVYDDQGEIVASGERAALREAYPHAQALDLGGATVIPGLIDAHGHLFGLGMTRLQADLVGAATLDEALQRLHQHAQSLPPDAWLLGRGWDQNDWPGQAFPSRADLDAVFPERPVWLRRIDGHAGWANSAALARVERDLSGDWQPDGGLIMRDDSGAATGILVDGAMALVDAVVPEPDEATAEQALDLALAETARLGLTGVHEAGTPWPILQLYLKRSREGRLPLRIYAMADGANETLARLCEAGPVTDEHGRVVARSVKLYADGALGSRGAAMLEPYSDAAETTGLLFHDNQALQKLVTKAMGCGLQVNTHAIGDAANRQVLDAYAQAMEQVPDHVGRHRIEHAQIVQVADIARFHDLGLIASMQPTHATSDMPWAEQRVGAERILGGYAWQRFISAEVPLALGSDFPVESADPLLGIYAAVTRMDLAGDPDDGWYADQRLSVEQAVAGFTHNAAYAAFMEEQVGQLTVGKRADFVALDRDIFQVDSRDMPHLKVLGTWLDGVAIYRAEE